MNNRTLLFLLLLFIGCTMPALAALPPLSDADRQHESSVVVQGRIVSVSETVETIKPGYSNSILTLKVRVVRTIKGDAVEGDVVEIRCWVIDERPEGWVGDGGQRPYPREGADGTFYASGKPDSLRLLSPNGWDPLTSD